MTTYKTIDYNTSNTRYTADEMIEFCKKMGIHLSKADIENLKKECKPDMFKDKKKV